MVPGQQNILCDSILSIDFVKANTGFITAKGSGIWRYEAGNWSHVFDVPDYTFNKVKFSSETSGYAASYEVYSFLPPPFNAGVKFYKYTAASFTELLSTYFPP